MYLLRQEPRTGWTRTTSGPAETRNTVRTRRTPTWSTAPWSTAGRDMERERDGHRYSDTERERERETETETERSINTQTHRERERSIDTQKEREIQRHSDRV